MAGRGAAKQWMVLLAMVGLLAGVGVVAMCLWPDADRAPAPSGNTGPIDPDEGQDAAGTHADAISTEAQASPEPNEATLDAVGNANEDADPDGSPASHALAEQAVAKPVPPTPGFVLCGQLVYEDGTPYRETLGLEEMLSVHVTASNFRRKCAIDDTGRFECVGLKAGSYTVSVVDALASRRLLCESAQIELHPEVAPEDVLLVLGPSVPVVVRVLDEQSLTPRAESAVAIESMWAVAEVSGETDTKGLCEFSLIGGQYRVSVSRWQEGRTMEVASKLIRVKPTDRALTVDLLVPASVAAGGMIRGVLVDAAGQPVEGYVMLEYTEQQSSGEVGSSFAIPEPDYQPPEGLLGYARDVSGQLGRRFLWRKGQSDEELTLVLEPHTSIVGQVVGTDRKPMPEVNLDLQIQMLDGSWRGADKTLDTPLLDSEGVFVFDRVPVGVKVKVAAHRGTLNGQSRRMTLTPGGPVDAGEIVMTGRRLGTGTIQGRITDETGASLADRAVQVQVGRHTQWQRTNGGGYFVLEEMPEGQPVTVTIEVDPYGPWSRVAVPDDYACDFQLTPAGWGVLDKEAPPLFAGKWFNHAPLTMEELRGRVVLLSFRNFDRDADPGLARLRNLQNEFGPRGLTTIAIYNSLPGTSRVAEDVVVEHLSSFLQGAPIAGLLDAAPALVADLMPAGRPAGASAGATHWMYQVRTRPAFYLIDKAGKVRHCMSKDVELRERLEELLGQ